MSFHLKLTDKATFGRPNCTPPARGKFNAVGFFVSALVWVVLVSVVVLAAYAGFEVARLVL